MKFHERKVAVKMVEGGGGVKYGSFLGQRTIFITVHIFNTHNFPLIILQTKVKNIETKNKVKAKSKYLPRHNVDDVLSKMSHVLCKQSLVIKYSGWLTESDCLYSETYFSFQYVQKICLDNFNCI